MARLLVGLTNSTPSAPTLALCADREPMELLVLHRVPAPRRARHVAQVEGGHVAEHLSRLGDVEHLVRVRVRAGVRVRVGVGVGVREMSSTEKAQSPCRRSLIA